MTYKKLYLWLFITLCLTMIACREEGVPKQESQFKGYISSSNDRWPSTNISVCWDLVQGYEIPRKRIEQHIRAEYQKAGLYFNGWHDCQKDERGLRIGLAEDSARSFTKDFGYHLDGVPQGVTLGVKHQCPAPYMESNCILNVALHEFGHAIGLHHEMNRPDDPGCSFNQLDGKGEKDALQIGPYDSQSIMNYCKMEESNTQNQLLTLSHSDLNTIRERYFGVVASVEPTLSKRTSLDDLDLTIVPLSLIGYRIKIGDFQTTNCQDEAGYLEVTNPRQKINRSFLEQNFTFSQSGLLKLCLLGQEANGKWQDIKSFSSLFLFQSEDFDAPQIKQVFWVNNHIQESDEARLRVQVEDQSRIIAMRVEAAYPATPLKFKSNQYQQINETNWYEIQFPSGTFSFQDEVRIESIYIRDAGDMSLNDWIDSSTGKLYLSRITLPSLFIVKGKKLDREAPRIEGLNFTSDRIRSGERAQLQVSLEEDSPIKEMSLTLTHRWDRNLSIFLRFPFEDRKRSHYELDINLELMGYAIQGDYYVSQITVSDILNNQATFKSNDQYFFESLNIEAPFVTVTDGYQLEKNHPVLKHCELPGSIEVDQSKVITLSVDEQSPLKSVAVSLQKDDGDQLKLFTFDQPIPKDGKFKLPIKFTSSDFKGKYRIAMITMIDLFQNQSQYRSDEEGKYFQDTNIAVPKTELVGGVEAPGVAPKLLDIIVPSKLKDLNSEQILVQVEEDHDALRELTLTFSKANDSGRIYIAGLDLPIVQGFVALPFQPKFWYESGEYRLSEIQITDHDGYVAHFVIKASDRQIGDTKVAVPYFSYQVKRDRGFIATGEEIF